VTSRLQRAPSSHRSTGAFETLPLEDARVQQVREALKLNANHV